MNERIIIRLRNQLDPGPVLHSLHFIGNVVRDEPGHFEKQGRPVAVCINGNDRKSLAHPQSSTARPASKK